MSTKSMSETAEGELMFFRLDTDDIIGVDQAGNAGVVCFDDTGNVVLQDGMFFDVTKSIDENNISSMLSGGPSIVRPATLEEVLWEMHETLNREAAYGLIPTSEYDFGCPSCGDEGCDMCWMYGVSDLHEEENEYSL